MVRASMPPGLREEVREKQMFELAWSQMVSGFEKAHNVDLMCVITSSVFGSMCE